MRLNYLAMARIAIRKSLDQPSVGLNCKRLDSGRTARAELNRLEVGGEVEVADWEVGIETDYSTYILPGDGTLTPFYR
jgi:hypothetical protein